MNLVHWERNLKEAMRRGFQVNLMCTFNVLCVTNFKSLLEKVLEWREEFGKDAIGFDTPYLKEPHHWMINILPESFNSYMDETLEFIDSHGDKFKPSEYEKFKRVTNFMRENPIDPLKIQKGRRDFYSFFNENDKRVGLNLLEVFPEYTEFYNYCKQVYENYG